MVLAALSSIRAAWLTGRLAGRSWAASTAPFLDGFPKISSIDPVVPVRAREPAQRERSAARPQRRPCPRGVGDPWSHSRGFSAPLWIPVVAWVGVVSLDLRRGTLAAAHRLERQTDLRQANRVVVTDAQRRHRPTSGMRPSSRGIAYASEVGRSVDCEACRIDSAPWMSPPSDQAPLHQAGAAPTPLVGARRRTTRPANPAVQRVSSILLGEDQPNRRAPRPPHRRVG